MNRLMSLSNIFSSRNRERVFLRLFLTLITLSGCYLGLKSEVVLKTNLLSDAALSPSLGVEFPLGERWSADISSSFNGWTLNGHRWRHWVVQPELRYWICERFAGHFFGFHLLAGDYNVGNLDMDFKFLGTDFSSLKNHRYQGWFGGAGVAYGYTWIFNRHWSMETEIGLGWTHTRYDKYRCADCGKKIVSGHPHNFVGVTKAALNLIYVF